MARRRKLGRYSRRDLPLRDTVHGKEMTLVSVTLPYVVTNSVTASTAYQGVLQLDPSNCLEWSGVSGAFDEYRITKIVCHYAPSTSLEPATWVASALGVMCIDLANSTALTSRASGIGHDVHAQFYMVTNPSQKMKKDGVTSLTYIPDFSPDKEWVGVTGPFAACYLKFYCPGADIPGTGLIGQTTVYFHLEFRGLSVA